MQLRSGEFDVGEGQDVRDVCGAGALRNPVRLLFTAQARGRSLLAMS
jgi:hypothetical protein